MMCGRSSTRACVLQTLNVESGQQHLAGLWCTPKTLRIELKLCQHHQLATTRLPGKFRITWTPRSWLTRIRWSQTLNLWFWQQRLPMPQCMLKQHHYELKLLQKHEPSKTPLLKNFQSKETPQRSSTCDSLSTISLHHLSSQRLFLNKNGSTILRRNVNSSVTNTLGTLWLPQMFNNNTTKARFEHLDPS